LNHVSDSYARAWSIGIAHNILQNLPKELRNMISKELLHLFNPRHKYHETNRKFTPGYDGRWNEPDLKSDHNRLPEPHDYPHYFKKEFMGEQFVTELSESFHSERRFVLQHPQEISGFLTFDRFGTGCIPMEHVRFLKIVVSLRHFSSITGHILKWSSPKFADPLQHHYKKAIATLDALKNIPVKRCATILFDVECRSHGGGPKFAEVLFPIVYDLRAKEWIVRIEGRYGEGKKDMKRTAKDFDYSVPREKWERKARTESAFVSYASRTGFCTSN
jgi:hypothetical protein